MVFERFFVIFCLANARSFEPFEIEPISFGVKTATVNGHFEPVETLAEIQNKLLSTAHYVDMLADLEQISKVGNLSSSIRTKFLWN